MVMKMKLVKCKYHDLTEHSSKALNEITHLKMKQLEIFGYLAEENKDVIKIIKEYDLDKEDCDVMVLPKSVVLNLVELKEKENSKSIT